MCTEPPAIYPFTVENGVQLGERVGLQCLVTKGDGPLTIQWLKDDVPVLDLQLPSLTVTGVGEFSSTLLIEQLATIHGGHYTCQAQNPVATSTHSVHLNINGIQLLCSKIKWLWFSTKALIILCMIGDIEKFHSS